MGGGFRWCRWVDCLVVYHNWKLLCMPVSCTVINAHTHTRNIRKTYSHTSTHILQSINAQVYACTGTQIWTSTHTQPRKRMRRAHIIHCENCVRDNGSVPDGVFPVFPREEPVCVWSSWPWPFVPAPVIVVVVVMVVVSVVGDAVW